MANKLSKSDFDNWTHDPVTTYFFKAIEDRIEDAKDLLADTAGKEPDQDSFLRGLIRAYREVLEVDYQEVDE